MRQNADFDIGTLFYIIVTIIAIAVGAFNKKKKPGGKSAPSDKGSSSPGLFERIEREFGGFIEETKESFTDDSSEATVVNENEQSIVEEAYVGEEVEQGVQYQNSEPSVYQQYEGIFDPTAIQNRDLLDAEAVPTTEENHIIDVIDLDEECEKPDYFEIVKDFDLGTAVIYSTIINRVEY